MNKINLLFFLFFPILCFGGQLHEETFIISPVEKIHIISILSESQNFEILELIKEASSKIQNKKFSSLDVNIKIIEQNNKISFSNADENKCKITLNYDSSLSGLLLKNLKNDIIFTYYHEISHCILGKKLFESGVRWKSLNSKNIDKINKKIETITNDALIGVQCEKNCLSVNVFKIAPPLIVYHEIYADLMAFNFFSKYDCIKMNEIFPEIRTQRLKKYKKDILSSTHQSFRSMVYIKNKNFCKNNLDLDSIQNLTEKGFLDYLKSIKD